MNTVFHIASPAYSGSSMLNLLLDSVDGVRGVGEVVHYHQDFPWITNCCRCRCAAKQCVVASAVKPDRFYHSIFEAYPDAVTLVDASKSIQYAMECRAMEECDHRVIVLYRDMHAVIESTTHHHPAMSPHEVEDLYMSFYEHQRGIIRESGWPCLDVRYRLLCEQTDRTLRTICEWAGIPFRRRANWWETDTHIIGGNYSVACQVQGREEFFSDGKYAGQYHRVFVDE
jgi:hypothetical protein